MGLCPRKERPDIRRDETGKIERVRNAFVVRNLPDVVTVIERRNALRVEFEHRGDVSFDGLLCRGGQRGVLRGIVLCCAPLIDAPPAGK